jgi:hypothetical protein
MVRFPSSVALIVRGVMRPLCILLTAPQDAAKPFGFPDTLTAASYVLRRAYAQLLWDFEQVRWWLHSCFAAAMRRPGGHNTWPALAQRCRLVLAAVTRLNGSTASRGDCTVWSVTASGA